MAAKIRKGDRVVVLTGRDKGRTGEVIEMRPTESRALVRGVNMVKRHQRQTASQEGGLVRREASIHLSNIAIVDPKDNKTPIGFNPDMARLIAAKLGVAQTAVADTLAAALRGADVSHLHDDNSRYPVPVRLEFSAGDTAGAARELGMSQSAVSGALADLERQAFGIAHDDYTGGDVMATGFGEHGRFPRRFRTQVGARAIGGGLQSAHV